VLEVSVYQVLGYKEFEEEAERPVLRSFTDQGAPGDAGEDKLDPWLYLACLSIFPFGLMDQDETYV